MSKANFYLKSTPDGKGKHLIYLFFSYQSVRLKYSISESIALKNWNKELQRARKNFPNSTSLNNRLDFLSNGIKKIYTDTLISDKIPTPLYLRNQLVKLEKKDVDIKQSLKHHFNEFLNEKSLDMQYRTIQKYKTLLSDLMKFQKQHSVELTYHNMNTDTYNSLVRWFAKMGKSDNTASKQISQLKTFLHWAAYKGYNQNIEFIKQFKTYEKDIRIIALTEDELINLINFVPPNHHLDITKDLFLLSIFTGLRYSDVIRLKKEFFIGEEIVIKTAKKHKDLNIPVLDPVLKIMQKYNYTPPPLSNAKLNKHLKKLCQLAGIDTPTTTYKSFGNEKNFESKTRPKYECITMHCGRKTYITLSLQRRQRAEVVMSIVGHTDYKTTQKYIALHTKPRIDETRNAWKSLLEGSYQKLS